MLLLHVRVVSTNAAACAVASPQEEVPASQAARKGHGVTVVEQDT